MMTTDHDGAGPIRTPDQRLRVFVSSTLAELAEERRGGGRGRSRRSRLTPVMFELGARPHPPQELYRAYLAQSRRVRRPVLAALRMDRAGDGHLGARGRVPAVRRDAAAAVPQDAGAGSGAAAGGDDRRRSSRRAPTPTDRSPAPRELGRLVRDDLALLLSERFAAAAPARRSARAGGGRRARPPRRSLPTPSTSLVGRDRDIAEVSTLLDRPDVRLVTLTGPGGIGKTRLAIAVGASARRRLGRRTVFVPLASITDPELVLAARRRPRRRRPSRARARRWTP